MTLAHVHTGETEISPALVRHAFGHFVTGVTVVTSLSLDGEPVGTTASAVSSLSLEPPLLLVCLDQSSNTLAAIRARRAFAVNVLAHGQQGLSANFAQSGADASWASVTHRPGHTGSPRIDDVLAVLECRLEDCLRGGDHEIVIGRLVEFELHAEGRKPLVHYCGLYGSLRQA
jgi:flavin reductase (DIM6/NTAB) family NADH-FMN oxidoreductase RutF